MNTIQKLMIAEFMESLVRYGYNFQELCEKWGVEPDIISEHGGHRGKPQLHMFSTAQRIAQHIMDKETS